MKPLSKPLLVYDGECSFCRKWVARWRNATGERIDYAAFQDVAGEFPEVPREKFAAAVQLLEPDGERYEAAQAVFRSLACTPGHGRLLWLYQHAPGFAPVSEWIYRRVASNRSPLDRLTDLVWGAHLVPPGERLTIWIFLRVLGVIFALAFLSMAVQITGLAGPQGILPARDLLEAVAAHYGPIRYLYLPTLCWFGASDGALLGMSYAGIVLSMLLAIGVAPRLTLFGAWLLYLSLVTAGQEFFWFQWDALLLETAFLSLFLTPWRLWSRPRDDPAPSRAGLWLMRWLLFRLVFSSAVVKLSSGDPNWRNLSALTWHYQTQPLPPWTAWYAHHLPVGFQKLSAGMMFMIEGLVPFLIFAPRRIRFASAAAMAGLQLLIFITGNYGVFNLLTIALCLSLLDDGVWPRRLRERFAPASAVAAPAPWPTSLRRAAATGLAVLSIVPLVGAFRRPTPWLAPVAAVHRVLAPLEISSSYGLFSVMTTVRNEIIVEGSADGRTWQPYEFRWKPGDVRRRPEFVAPHMPRVDWQMWFAALSDFRRETWFLRFCERLLRGSEPVMRLLERNPFFPLSPRYVRAVVWEYRFTDAATRSTTGEWWWRERRGLYCPVLTLVNGQLAAVEIDSAGVVISPP